MTPTEKTKIAISKEMTYVQLAIEKKFDSNVCLAKSAVTTEDDFFEIYSLEKTRPFLFWKIKTRLRVLIIYSISHGHDPECRASFYYTRQSRYLNYILDEYVASLQVHGH